MKLNKQNNSHSLNCDLIANNACKYGTNKSKIFINNIYQR
jgi:hypothetical protein